MQENGLYNHYKILDSMMTKFQFISFYRDLNYTFDKDYQDTAIESLHQISFGEFTRNDLFIWIIGVIIAMYIFVIEILYNYFKT